jgi:hypothetical protein
MGAREGSVSRGGGRKEGRIAKRELVQVKGFAFSATLCWIRKKKKETIAMR